MTLRRNRRKEENQRGKNQGECSRPGKEQRERTEAQRSRKWGKRGGGGAEERDRRGVAGGPGGTGSGLEAGTGTRALSGEEGSHKAKGLNNNAGNGTGRAGGGGGPAGTLRERGGRHQTTRGGLRDREDAEMRDIRGGEDCIV
ncbi:keratin, type I cytoskeletal 9-like [Gigantopelta aegis]|uniref:keratin, type I cytoskeletal 9-like n=1 Tax=Gigantopelta aegis TaxID=1735272 RepID=UPI001B88987B|nr:keratin, type I cytoskeletal 9-like [Gigantopelta aegis]